MAASVFICAGIGAAIVTLVELGYRNQRHPFGDTKNKALAWWALLTSIDVLLAVFIVLGLSELEMLRRSADVGHGMPDWGQGLAIGAFGPLALRSPIRTKEIRSEKAPIGITYVYDIARLYIFFAVDERMVRLRRADVTKLRQSWMSANVTAIQVAEYLRKHIEDHPQLQAEAKDEALDAVSKTLTLPGEAQQLDALIKFMRASRFSSVRDHFIGVAQNPGKSRGDASLR